MGRVDDLITDLKLLINEHYALGKQIEENAILKAKIKNIKEELHATAEKHSDGEYYLREKWIDEIIDKYKEA